MEDCVPRCIRTSSGSCLLILNVVDTVRTVKVLYSTSASVFWDVYILILMDWIRLDTSANR
jgi:hypothetical protein